jgi:NADH-quinone oxidoreductase subunit F
VDVHLLEAQPSEAERRAVDHLLGPPESGWEGGMRDASVDTRVAADRGAHGAKARRDLLLPAFHAVHEHIGWISPGALNYVCSRLTVPPADAYGVATFYALFSLDWRPPRVVHVCDDIACRCHGSDELIEELERHLGPEGTVLSRPRP